MSWVQGALEIIEDIRAMLEVDGGPALSRKDVFDLVLCLKDQVVSDERITLEQSKAGFALMCSEALNLGCFDHKAEKRREFFYRKGFLDGYDECIDDIECRKAETIDLVERSARIELWKYSEPCSCLVFPPLNRKSM
jgi:hypothetical protein